MRVAFFTVMYGTAWGGSEELWSQTALKCLNSGDDVCVGVFTWSVNEPRVQALANADAVITSFPLPNNNPKRFYRRWFDRMFGNNKQKSINESFRRIKEFAPDIICVSQGGTYNISANAAAYNFLIRTNKPFAIICQHNFENGGGLSKEQAGYESVLFDKASAVLFVAERNLHVAQRQLGHTIARASVIGNPLNISNLGIRPIAKASTTLKMACVARFDTKIKGQDILLEALSVGGWNDRDFKLSFYGSGPDTDYINRLIQFYGLNDKVVIEGFTNNIETIWDENDILVLPSISEGTPLCMVEAMLCGRPVLATDVGGVSKYVIEGQTGFLASAASCPNIVAALERLWQNHEILAEIGTRAYHHAINITDLNPTQTLRHILQDIAGK